MSKMRWTREQLAAITARDCNLLVSAAAGTGKTAVLVERIINRVTDPVEPVDIDRLLVVTFTKAAAAEMRSRIGEAIAAKLRGEPGNKHLRRQLALLNRACITTLHSFCLDLVRQHFHRLQLDPSFKIADDIEAALLRLEALDDVFESWYAAIGEDSSDSSRSEAFTRLVDAYGGERDDSLLQDIVLKMFEFARSTPFSTRWLETVRKSFDVAPGSTAEKSWVRRLMDVIRVKLKALRAELQQALIITRYPAGPASYEENLVHEIAVLDSIIKACDEGWDVLFHRIAGVDFARLKPCKGADETLKERVRKLRDGVKGQFKKLRETYFARPLEEHVRDLRAISPLIAALVDLVKDFEERYRRYKAERALLDFDDLEHYALELLSEGHRGGTLQLSPIARELQERFVEVLVDEYQDINDVQEAILSLVSRCGDGSSPNRFMVGDVKQSIYRFRLAEPGLFMSKYEEYPLLDVSGIDVSAGLPQVKRQVGALVAGRPQCRVNLARNFRCRKEIVDAVNFLFKQLMTPETGEIAYTSGAELVYGAHYPEAPGERMTVGGPVELYLLEKGSPGAGEDLSENGAIEEGCGLDEQEDLDADQREARLVARRIRELVDGQYQIYDKRYGGYRPVQYRDVVVLLRAVRGRASVFLDEFRLWEIPAYAEVGTGYFEAVEVDTVLSLLKVIDNPRQDLPLVGVLRSPMVGLKAGDLARIRLCKKEGDFYEAVCAAAKAELGELSCKLQEFLNRLERWRTMARQEPLPDLIWDIYRTTGFYDYAGAMPGGPQRQANLRALQDRARQYEATSFRGLFRFLRFINRIQESGSDLGAARALGENENVVRIMSIHKSKGLEFPVVFVAGMGRRFNRIDTRGDILLHKQLGLGVSFVDPEARVRYPTLAKLAIQEQLNREMLAEELRVLYVALTRAREKLVMVGSVNNLPQNAEKWCRHLSDTGHALPEAVILQGTSFLDWICPAVARHPDGTGLREIAETPEEEHPAFRDDPSRWQVVIAGAGDEGRVPEHSGVNLSCLAQVDKLEPVKTAPVLPPAVERRLTWSYPYEKVVGYTAKVSVTEIKRRFDEMPGEEDASHRVYYRYRVERPRFLQQQGGLRAAERGLAVHMVMRHVDLSGDLSTAGIAHQIEQMVDKELLTSQQAATINVEKIAAFFVSPLGERMLKARSVHRERPFSLALPVAAIYPDIDDECSEGETVLVQGIIDCLFDEGDGLVLVDYKTDDVSEKQVEEIRQRYQGQLNLYALAAETILGRQVKERYLYLFEPNEVLAV
ncbi:MAG: helicase-exonuclease AddAB subunit AddA [Peptococcaceae bacterium]|nr:helicase-exonuclease AddAB subunit AddA [Peptococcaceae bacterium]